MPLELGLFLGAKRFGIGAQKRKRCLVLDRERFRFQAFISDIAGQDVESHQGEIGTLIAQVRDFLDNTTGGKPLPSGAVIMGDFTRMSNELPAICVRLKLDPTDLKFKNYVWIVAEFIKMNGP